MELFELLDQKEAIANTPSTVYRFRATPQLPKNIFIYWHQGIRNAPEIVKLCAESWVKRNPTWNIKILNATSAKRYLRATPEDYEISIQLYSDLLRLRLLEQYGGVWADATCLCSAPLDDYIHWIIKNSGCFFFSHPGYDRIVASWFIAGTPKNPLITQWHRHLSEAITAHKKAQKEPPYFLCHYVFEHMLQKASEEKEIYDNAAKIPAAPALIAQRALATDMDIGGLEDLFNYPVLKLTHKAALPMDRLREVLERLGH